jgi:hypothetical protein
MNLPDAPIAHEGSFATPAEPLGATGTAPLDLTLK